MTETISFETLEHLSLGFSSDEIRRHLQSSYVSSFDAGQVK